MKIAYVGFVPSHTESGILKKIAGQIGIWMNEGHDVKLFLASPSTEIWEGIRHIPIEIIPYRNATRAIFGMNFDSLLKWNPDIVYLRQYIYFPAMRKLFRYPTVLEINTDDRTEKKNGLSKVKYIYHRITRNVIYRKADGFISVTRELGERYREYGKPTLAIANGIDLSLYEVHPPVVKQKPELVFIGTPGIKWHGVEKIHTLAEIFPEWLFHIIGSEPAEGQSCPPNIQYHGYLVNEEYRSILDRADCAIGTLSLYLNNLNEASTLKVREYLACGIPIIIGYRDTDFIGKEDVPFLLELPNTDHNIIPYADKIREFVDHWFGRRFDTDSIAHIDVKRKEKDRLEFFVKMIKRS